MSKSRRIDYIDRTTNVLNGGPEPDNYDEGTESLGQLCIKKLSEIGDYVMLIDGLTGEKVTAFELRDRSIHLAQCLIAAGVTPGDQIGISAENRLEFAYVLFGTLIAGATLAPMNVTYTEREIHHAMGLSKPRMVFAAPNTIERIVKAAKQSNFVERVIVFGKASKNATDVEEFELFFNNPQVRERVEDFVCKPQDKLNNVSLILCSSGTTGMPKGVQLTQNNISLGIAQHMDRDRDLEDLLAPNLIVLSIIPWFHAFGCITLISSMLHRTRVVFLPKFEEVSFLEAIQKFKTNELFMVPPLMVFLAKSPLVAKYDLTSLKIIWCGAAPLTKELEESVQRRLNIPVIRQGYGMTEGSLSFTGQTDNNHKPGSVGVLRSGFLGRLVDIETGRNVGPYEKGELWFKGRAIMKGYVGDLKATNQTIDEDGWLHTGDIGYYDVSGEVFVVDRLKELIKYKGFQVPPAEIEGLLLQNTLIRDCGVIGVADDDAGELPLAFVVKQDNSKLTERDVIDFVAERASPAKRLHGGVIFVDAIPKNPSGKILRRELRDLLTKFKSKL